MKLDIFDQSNINVFTGYTHILTGTVGFKITKTIWCDELKIYRR